MRLAVHLICTRQSFSPSGQLRLMQDEVEALAVAVGLGDSETFAGGFVGEG